MTVDNLHGNPNAFTWRIDALFQCDDSKMKDPTNLVFYRNATIDAVESHIWTDLGWGAATGDPQCFYDPNNLVKNTMEYADGTFWNSRNHIRTYSGPYPETSTGINFFTLGSAHYDIYSTDGGCRKRVLGAPTPFGSHIGIDYDAVRNDIRDDFVSSHPSEHAGSIFRYGGNIALVKQCNGSYTGSSDGSIWYIPVLTDCSCHNNTATPNLTVTVSDSSPFGPDSIGVGEVLTYGVLVSNQQGIATDVILDNTIPNNVSFIGADTQSGDCQGSSVVHCLLGNIAAGDSVLVMVQVKPRSAAAGTTIQNVATVSSADPETTMSDNTASQSTSVRSSSTGTDLYIETAQSPSTVAPGDTVTYTWVLRNAQSSTITDATLIDNLPNGFVVNAITWNRGSCAPQIGMITCSFGTLTSGQTGSLTVIGVIVPSWRGDVTHRIVVFCDQPDSNYSNNEVFYSTSTNPKANMSVTIVDRYDPVKVGDAVIYDVSVQNSGPSTATNIVLDVGVGSGLAVDWSGSGTQCINGIHLVCTLGDVLPGGGALISVPATSSQLGLTGATASVAASELDPQAANNSSSAPTTIVSCLPRPRVALSVLPDGQGHLTVAVGVTLSSGTPANYLIGIQFPLSSNGLISYQGQSGPGNLTFTPPTNSASGINFTVGRQVSGQAVTVPMTVRDGCGDWTTFVGGGVSAF